MMQIFLDTMKGSGESPERENVSGNSKWDGENQFETSHNRSLLITGPVEPGRRTRAVVKGQSEKEHH